MRSLGLFISVVLFSFIMLLGYRGFFWSLLHYLLNNNAYKKRKTNQTFLEWLLLSRFKVLIPRILLAIYYSVLFSPIVELIICVCVWSGLFSDAVNEIVARVIICYQAGITLIIQLLFYQVKPGWAFERWIPKTRGQRKKK